MDGTLNEYLKNTPEEAIEKIENLKQEVNNVQGEFIGIWHNETLNERGIWNGWRNVFEKALNE